MIMEVGTAKGFCYDTSAIFQFIGFIVLVLKVIIPIVLIVIGMIALGKAVVADDDKEIKTAVTSILKKFIAAVLIFFIPSIISALFSVVNGINDVQADYNTCVKCITSPRGSTCKNAVAGSQNS